MDLKSIKKETELWEMIRAKLIEYESTGKGMTKYQYYQLRKVWRDFIDMECGGNH